MCVCACLCVKSLNMQLRHTVRVRITELVSLIAAPRRKHRLAARLPLAACWWACRAPVVTNLICGAASSGPRPPRYQASTTRLLLAHARATRLPAPARAKGSSRLDSAFCVSLLSEGKGEGKKTRDRKEIEKSGEKEVKNGTR